jgi:hypothetical protein
LRLKIQTLNHHQMVIRTEQTPLGCGFSGSSVWKYEANSSPNGSFSVRDQQKLNLTVPSLVLHGTIPNSVSLDAEGPGKQASGARTMAEAGRFWALLMLYLNSPL